MSIHASRSKRRRTLQDSSATGRTGDGKRSLYHCNYCSRDISEGCVRIKCAVCQDFDLCAECFSVGAELGSHLNCHSYRVMDYLSFPLFHPEWGADEEFLLLEAIDMFGLGNWGQTAHHVNGDKSIAVCQQHYFQTYVEGPDAPMPVTSPELIGISISDRLKMKVRPAGKPGHTACTALASNVGDAQPAAGTHANAATHTKTSHEGQPSKPDATPALSTTDPRPDAGTGGGVHASDTGDAKNESTSNPVTGQLPQQQQTHVGFPVNGRVQNNKVEVTGYMSLRDEFDPEYDGDAELPIADIEFLASDPPELRAMKLHMLEIYNERLDEREARRALVKKQGLTDVRKLQNSEKRRTPFDRRFHAAARVFERFQDACSHEALCEGLLLETKLTARISELKSWRRAGARTFADGDSYLEMKKRQEAMAAGRPSGRPDRNHTRVHTPADETPGIPVNMALIPSTPFRDPSATASSSRLPPAPLTSWRNKRNATLDISCWPGTHLLSHKERELCTQQRLLPAHYLLLKETLMREVELHGPISRSDARTLFRLEPNRSQKIHELVVSAGWTSSHKKGHGDTQSMHEPTSQEEQPSGS